MADPNMVDFYERVSRYERMKARGHGFEAYGTLGRADFPAARASRRPILKPALTILVAFFILKGITLYTVGEATYQMRVDKLLVAEGTIDYVGGWLMQADPLTRWVADLVATGVNRIY